MARAKLSQDKIVQSALSLIDTSGEKAFSMRKLAAALGVDPMAIYHHLANRNAVLHAVIQAMMDSFEIPPPGGTWQQDIRALCHAMRQVGLRHPGAFRIYETNEDWLPGEHRVHEAFHATLRNAGFGRKVTVQGVRLLLAFTETFVVDEISGWLDPEDQADLANSLASGPYPVLTDLVDDIVQSDADADFDFGLRVLIRGLEGELT